MRSVVRVINFATLKQDLLGLLMKSFNKVLIEKVVQREGKMVREHYWVNPDEVKHDDRVRYNRHLLDDNHPQRHNQDDDIIEGHEIHSEEEAESILGSLLDNDSPVAIWFDHKTVGETKAIKNYTGGPCKAINSYLRGIFKLADALAEKDDEAYWNTRMLKTVIPTIFHLDKAISKFETPVPLRVHRIVSKDMMPKFLEAQKNGGIFVEDGYCSTTLIQGSFGDEGNDINLVIDVPPGKGIGAYVEDVSEYGGEYEYLMARGTMFKIHSITPATKDHGAIIHMQAVGRKENNSVLTPTQLSDLLLKQQLSLFRGKLGA